MARPKALSEGANPASAAEQSFLATLAGAMAGNPAGAGLAPAADVVMEEPRGPVMAPPAGIPTAGGPASANAPPASVGYVTAAMPGVTTPVHPAGPKVMPMGTGVRPARVSSGFSNPSRRTSNSSGAFSGRSAGCHGITRFPGLAGRTPHPSAYHFTDACDFCSSEVSPEVARNLGFLVLREQDIMVREVRSLKDLVRCEADGLAARMFEVAAFHESRFDMVFHCLRDLNDRLFEIHAMLAQVWEGMYRAPFVEPIPVAPVA